MHCYAITLFCYATIFDNELIGDDRDFINSWPEITSIQSIPKLLSGNLPEVHQGTYRPIRSLLYLFSYQLWETNVVGYHIFSLIVHVSCVLLVYKIALKLSENRIVSILSAVLFSIHPIHVEAVTFVTASYDTAAFVFLLASFYIFIITKPKINNFSLGLFLLALLTNETTYIFPLILSAYLFFISRYPFKKILLATRYYWFLLIVVVFIRFGLLSITSRSEYLGGSFLSAQLVSIKAIVYALYLMIFPLKRLLKK